MLQAKLLNRASGMLMEELQPEGDKVNYRGEEYQLPENWRETPIMKVGGYRTTANGYAWCFDCSRVVE